jgi:hypothetical protein
VEQTGLNDSSVSYEINAFTDLPNEMTSSFRGTKTFRKSSTAPALRYFPTYLSMRDGNSVTIPEAQRPPGYTAPGFRVHMESNGKW